MKTAASMVHPLPVLDAETERPVVVRAREKVAALVELTKPRISVMVLATVAVGYLCGDRHGLAHRSIWWTILGTGLVAGGASAWNQILERSRDARMRRTRNRPLPSSRVTPAEAALFGSALTVLGLAILLLGANTIAAGLAFATFASYVLIYTPLKPVTTLNTFVGAIPGAIPPVIGWSAATGHLGGGAAALFLIQFLWQFPHFLAIAWIYREDYARGGYRMLPILDPSGRKTGLHATLYALVLVPAGVLPTFVGVSGWIYLAGAVVLGILYLAYSIRFWRDPIEATARRLMFASFFYLPMILLLLMIDPAK